MQLKVIATNINVLQFFLHFNIFILKAILSISILKNLHF